MAIRSSILINLEHFTASHSFLLKIVGWSGFFVILLTYIIQGMVMLPFILWDRRVR